MKAGVRRERAIRARDGGVAGVLLDDTAGWSRDPIVVARTEHPGRVP